MGSTGIGKVLYELGDKVAGDAVRGFGNFLTKETGSYGFVRSGEALLDKSETGKYLKDYINNNFEKYVRQEGQVKLDQKIAAGVHPTTASQEAIRESYKEARTKFFGKKDEILINTLHAATKEKGKIYGQAVSDLMSVYLNDSRAAWRSKKTIPTATGMTSLGKMGLREPQFRTRTEFESNLRASLSWMYTPLIAIPHTAQVGNIILDNVNTPIKAIAGGLSEYFSSGVTKQKFTTDLIRSGSLFDEIRYEIMSDVGSQGKGGKLYQAFHHPGFNFVRRQEISLAAAIGKHAALEAADRLSANPADKWATHALQKLSIDPTKLAQAGYKLTDDEIGKAMYAEADRTIFFRNQLKTPWRWEESFVARMGSQYRHFQFRQGKFLVDTFKDSYKEGGALGLSKAIGTFAILFPIFGEMVHSIENLTDGKNPLDRDPKSQFGNEYTDAMAHAAGFGIFYSIMRSGMWNGGRGFLEGPLLSTAEDILIGVPHDIAEGRYGTATRRVLRKLGVPGRIGSELMK